VRGTVSTAAKEKLAREAGAAQIVRYTEIDDLAGEVRRLTGGDGVAAVYDGVGASTFDASLASLRPRGMLALYGAASGPVPPVDPQRLNSAGSVFLTRPKLADYVPTREELRWRAGEVFEAISGGSLRMILPPFITNRTRCSSVMSASGSPETAIRSANFPLSIEPS